VKKKVGRPCKYGENDRVEQVPLYLPGSKIEKLPKQHGKRNEWLVSAVDEKLKKEGR
jgi:hypothetical protein